MNIPVSFPISVFENSGEKISDTLTKKRESGFSIAAKTAMVVT